MNIFLSWKSKDNSNIDTELTHKVDSGKNLFHVQMASLSFLSAEN